MNKKFLIKLLTFLGGIYFFLEFFLPEKIGDFKIGAYHDQISQGMIVIGSMAAGLGIINILFIHGGKVIFQKKGWLNSLALLIGLFSMLFITISDWQEGDKNTNQTKPFIHLSAFSNKIVRENNLSHHNLELLKIEAEKILVETNNKIEELSLTYKENERFIIYKNKYLEKENEVKFLLQNIRFNEDLNIFSKIFIELATNYRELVLINYENSLSKKLYNFLYDGLFVSLGSAMFALLAFYVASAAYRAFRIKTLEAGLMMLAALLVMFGQIPFGIWIWEGFTDVRLWLLEVPNSAAFRAITIGSGVAGLIMAFRMWLSIESESFNE